MASHIDNIILPMLLWPHAAIKNGGFIDRRDDTTLLAEAVSKLDLFSYSDIIENPDFHRRLQTWMDQISHIRV